MTIDHNSPDGRLWYFLDELLGAGFVPEEYEEEVREALTAYEVSKE